MLLFSLISVRQQQQKIKQRLELKLKLNLKNPTKAKPKLKLELKTINEISLRIDCTGKDSWAGQVDRERKRNG